MKTEDTGRTEGAATPARGLVGSPSRVFEAHVLPFWRDRRKRLAFVGTTLALAVGSTFAWEATRAEIRVVNATTEPLILVLDGERQPTLATVAVETPNAGMVVRTSPGRHALQVIALDGRTVEVLHTALVAGGKYLFAPGESDQCFFVEHAAYGRAKPELEPLRQLPKDDHFWRLPANIDAWFVPNPVTSGADKRSSGGVRTSVRQSTCAFLPWH